MEPIKIYSTPSCTFCTMAKEIMDEEGVPYEDYDVTESWARREEMVELSGGKKVPVIVMGETVTVGFDRESFMQALDEYKNEKDSGHKKSRNS
jgi:glutaredoxin 3